jgi:uncharacterized protein
VAHTIPLFPLQHVLYPGTPLPLHIFEPRYRRLLADLSAGDGNAAFGVVALDQGLETASDVAFAPIGTLAEILDRKPYPDGACDLLTVGSRRFRILDVDDTSKPYLQAEVDWLPEQDGRLAPGLLAAAAASFEKYVQLRCTMNGTAAEDRVTGDALRLSYEIAARVTLSTKDRQSLLAAETAADRLRTELALMRHEMTLMHETRSIPMPFSALHIVPTPN